MIASRRYGSMKSRTGLRVRGGLLVCSVALLVASCGEDEPMEDTDDPVMPAQCGNGVVETGEDCDDGDTALDSLCDSSCHAPCGNGVVDTTIGELCDPGIADGEGACPATCDDGDACTADVMSGTACQASCENAPITVPVAGDGCCPDGATMLTDADCAAECGNGAVETGEACDTAIAAGPGACPATCNDGLACTVDTLASAGTCQAACATTNITTPIDGDGCCPPGFTSIHDNDCVPGCGNGVVEAGEICDTAIASGAGRCPTSCSDGLSCTTDVLSGAGTCAASCGHATISTCAAADGCCPGSCNANTDSDCAPACGNQVVESGEQCDDGNTNPGDACDACRLTVQPPTAFRMTDLDLRDPHIFVEFIGCVDVTDSSFLPFSVNAEVQSSIEMDKDGDGDLDLSVVTVFRPFNQTAGGTVTTQLHFPTCTPPAATTMCRPGADPITPVTATFGTGTAACLTPLAGTTKSPAYSPAITNSSAPCFSTNPATVNLNLGGIPITLRDARLGATLVGNPATRMTNGILMGFITEAEANATIIPAEFPLVGGKPLSLLLPGGDPPGADRNCASHDDRDTHPTLGTRGWWFYLNFPAAQVTWQD